LDLIPQGARWRIGFGASIPLFGAPWLKDGCSFSTQSPLYALLAHVKIQDIIEPSTKVWNATLIYNMFDHNTTQLILNTPLHPLAHEDKFIWKAEKNGSYSVRNVYQICVTEIADTPICIFRVNGVRFGSLKCLPRFKILFGVCVGAVSLHVHT